jgi:hypothetical protein
VNNYYANVITRCFVAEGVSHKHGLFLADLIDGEERYLQVSQMTKKPKF